MRRETQACHGCYGTNSVLAIKINVVLEINSLYSADRREGTDDLKTLQNFANKKKLFILKLADQLVTLQFKEALKENKERKHLRSSGEIVKKKKD